MRRSRAWLTGIGLWVAWGAVGLASDLPIHSEHLEAARESPFVGVRNQLSLEQLWGCIGAGSNYLSVNLAGVTRLLDGSEVDPARIYGRTFAGPYPFEAKETSYAYKRFRAPSEIRGGQGTIRVGSLLGPGRDSEDWTDRGQVVVRLELHLEGPGPDRPLGTYDMFVFWRKGPDGLVKLPSLVEGPFVSLTRSDEPEACVISFRTDEPVVGAVLLEDGREFAEATPALKHEIAVSGLEPDSTYRYRVRVGSMTTQAHELKTAPLPGHGETTLVYIGDSREGVGGGDRNYMGLNHATLERLFNQAYLQDADFVIMGGDLINGYTSSKPDFEAQLRAWTQAAAGFWHRRAVFTGMGNHEALLRVFLDAEGRTIALDRWPYATDSAEAVFADWFTNPENGPTPSDPRRPSYGENVYSFQFGPVKVISFNNNYWFSSSPTIVGGSPEGYILPDQLEWLKRQLKSADRDETVRFVVLFAQEPVFPNGGHVRDAMWYHGNNNVRAWSLDARSGEVRPMPKGMLEVRDELVRAIAASPKVAVVLGGDEHNYHRTLIGPRVPIGDIRKDDRDRNGRIDVKAGESISPLGDLRRSTWYIVSGGGGAPYYGEEETPWNRYWKSRREEEGDDGYYFSSQENIVVLQTQGERISLRVLNPYGEQVDEIDDLMSAR